MKNVEVARSTQTTDRFTSDPAYKKDEVILFITIKVGGHKFDSTKYRSINDLTYHTLHTTQYR